MRVFNVNNLVSSGGGFSNLVQQGNASSHPGYSGSLLDYEGLKWYWIGNSSQAIAQQVETGLQASSPHIEILFNPIGQSLYVSDSDHIAQAQLELKNLVP